MRAAAIALATAMALLVACQGTSERRAEVERARPLATERPDGGGAAGVSGPREPAAGDRGNVGPSLAGGAGSGAGATAAARMPLLDAHIHWSEDAWSTYPPERAIAILREAGVARAFVSSTPDAGTIRLWEIAPDVVVPVLRPYRTRDDIGSWTRDPSIIPYVEARYRRGVHRGIGEFHLGRGESATPVVRAIVALAVREGLFLHAHADDGAVAELAATDARATVLWAHAGMSASPETIAGILDRHPNVWVELALRSDVMSGDRLDPGWRALFLRYPDRILVGTDTWVPPRWDDVVAGHERTRRWLADLPAEVARKIATDNGARLLGPPR